MFSDVIKAALEKEVVGQPRAVNGVVRGVTRLVSGVTPRERSWCAFMFVGPTGTGKTHLIKSVARVLHGNENRVVVADCARYLHGDPWMAFASQLVPLFAAVPARDPWAGLQAPPLSIIQIDYLERGPVEVIKALTSALETGHVTLPQGQWGGLGNCLIFLTSGLCSREILDEATGIGFTASLDAEDAEDEQDRVRGVCVEQAEKQFGSDLVGRLDGLFVFRRLDEQHLPVILDRLTDRLDRWMALRGFHCELSREARSFLVERGARDLRRGARELIRAHRRYVEFPVADLLVSGRIPPGGMVRIDRRAAEEHLHFTVSPRPDAGTPREVPVTWIEADREWSPELVR